MKINVSLTSEEFAMLREMSTQDGGVIHSLSWE